MSKFYRLFRYDLPLHFALLLTNWLPDNVIFLRLRGFIAHFFLGNTGSNLRLGRNVTFYNPSKITIGNNVYIAYGCWLMAGEVIEISDEVMFGPYCVVVSSDHQLKNDSFRFGEPKQEPIHIGKGSWLGAHVTVTSGSHIGSTTIVAAGAVVNGIYHDRIILGGVPARVIKLIGNIDGK